MNKIILYPSDLNKSNFINVNFTMPKKIKQTLITGSILDSTNTPVEKAIIKVSRQNLSNNTTEEIGYAFSDEYGGFYVLVEKSSDYNYFIDIYEPMIN